MGNNLGQTPQKTKFEDHILIAALGEGRSLMRNRVTGKQMVIVEHTFAS
jgi:hypothetical protein